MNKKFLYGAAILAAPPLLLSLTQLPHQAALSMFISVVLLWFTEIVPLAVTGLMVPLLAILYGLAGPKEAFGPFGNQVLFLFIGSFPPSQS